MAEYRFTFLDNARGNDADLAATILAESLRRQGYQSRNLEATVTAIMPEADRTGVRHILVAMDERLLEGLEGDPHTVIVCTARPARTVLEELQLPAASVTTVDADGIALDEGADPVAALLGGAARAVPQIEPDTLAAVLFAAYDRRLPHAAQAAVRAMDIGYRQAQFAC